MFVDVLASFTQGSDDERVRFVGILVDDLLGAEHAMFDLEVDGAGFDMMKLRWGSSAISWVSSCCCCWSESAELLNSVGVRLRGICMCCFCSICCVCCCWAWSSSESSKTAGSDLPMMPALLRCSASRLTSGLGFGSKLHAVVIVIL